jgi:hypothetical protein
MSPGHATSCQGLVAQHGVVVVGDAAAGVCLATSAGFNPSAIARMAARKGPKRAAAPGYAVGMNRRTACATLMALVLTAAATPTDAVETEVRISRDGELVLMDAVLLAPVTPAEAWAVLTDFDAMARYVPDLDASRVTIRLGNRLRVEQRGVARWGPFARPFAMVREVDLTPVERVESRSIGGTLQRVRTSTRLVPVTDGTEVRHHLEFVFNVWMPDLLADAFLRYKVREQFDAVVEEMLQRRISSRK